MTPTVNYAPGIAHQMIYCGVENFEGRKMFAVSEPSAKVFSAKFSEICNAHVTCMHMRVRCACVRAKPT